MLGTATSDKDLIPQRLPSSIPINSNNSTITAICGCTFLVSFAMTVTLMCMLKKRSERMEKEEEEAKQKRDQDYPDNAWNAVKLTITPANRKKRAMSSSPHMAAYLGVRSKHSASFDTSTPNFVANRRIQELRRKRSVSFDDMLISKKVVQTSEAGRFETLRETSNETLSSEKSSGSTSTVGRDGSIVGSFTIHEKLRASSEVVGTIHEESPEQIDETFDAVVQEEEGALIKDEGASNVEESGVANIGYDDNDETDSNAISDNDGVGNGACCKKKASSDVVRNNDGVNDNDEAGCDAAGHNDEVVGLSLLALVYQMIDDASGSAHETDADMNGDKVVDIYVDDQNDNSSSVVIEHSNEDGIVVANILAVVDTCEDKDSA